MLLVLLCGCWIVPSISRQQFRSRYFVFDLQKCVHFSTVWYYKNGKNSMEYWKPQPREKIKKRCKFCYRKCRQNISAELKRLNDMLPYAACHHLRTPKATTILKAAEYIAGLEEAVKSLRSTSSKKTSIGRSLLLWSDTVTASVRHYIYIMQSLYHYLINIYICITTFTILI